MYIIKSRGGMNDLFLRDILEKKILPSYRKCFVYFSHVLNIRLNTGRKKFCQEGYSG